MISYSNGRRFILFTSPLFRRGKGRSERGSAIPKTYTQEMGDSPCAVHGVGTHLLNCWPRTCVAEVNISYMQKIVEVVEMLPSGKDGTRECTKCSIVPSLSLSIVWASSRDRDDSFSQQVEKGGVGGGHWSQLQHHEPPG